MSAESLAALRKSAGNELANLAEEHLKNDLQQSDREALRSAASKLSTHAAVGSILGLGLGIVLAYRVRANRAAYFKAFRAIERPTHVKFADGREEAIPDITPLLKPTPLGDIAAYTLFSAGGIFFGGELGLLSGSSSAKRTITKDPETRARVEHAFRAFRADILRREVEKLESGKGDLGL